MAVEGGSVADRMLERQTLRTLYTEANANLSELVAKLAKSAGSSDTGTFDTIWAKCEAQRRLCNEILEQILDHIRLPANG